MWIISAGVLLASSTWFAGTALTPALVRDWALSESQAAVLTSSVQVGFITGTLLYALTNLADRFNARRVFFYSALSGALCNLLFAWGADNLGVAAVLRFFTGVTLAGVYPVGMKIIASWFDRGLGWRLGVMVGALTIGTGLPFAFRLLPGDLEWRSVAAVASLAAVGGALLVRFVLSDGPLLRHSAPFDVRMMVKVFRNRAFRINAFGYFGHMWELYAFWSLLIFYLQAALADQAWATERVIALVVFIAVVVGGLGCAGGGWISRRVGERQVALWALLGSAAGCLLSGVAFHWPPFPLVIFLCAWGVFIVADSPQFSALAARYCPPAYTGTALTSQNGVGFAITIIAIQLVPEIAARVGWQWAFLVLAPGPLFGAWCMWRLGSIAAEPVALPEEVG